MADPMLLEMVNIPDEVCEHCQIGMSLYTFYGRQRVYECDLNQYPKDCLAGFFEPCEGYHCGNGKRGDDWKPKYKQIPIFRMKKSEECLQQEREEQKDRDDKARRLRKEAEELLLKARELEN
jgi:hypothetical protein